MDPAGNFTALIQVEFTNQPFLQEPDLIAALPGSQQVLVPPESGSFRAQFQLADYYFRKSHIPFVIHISACMNEGSVSPKEINSLSESYSYLQIFSIFSSR